MKEVSQFVLIVTVFIPFLGCQPTGVGDPCRIEVTPEGGLEPSDKVLETDSLQCLTGTCMHFNGHQFCTQRCTNDSDCLAEWYEEGPGQDGAEGCSCSVEIEVGPEGIQGSYCVPDHALTMMSE